MNDGTNRFYELLWQIQTDGRRLPLPWWAQQYFRKWTDAFRAGPYQSKQDAFASNAFYRYWNMIGVKDHHQEILIGQAGEVEPVDDEYALSFFLFDNATKTPYFPQYPDLTAAQPPMVQAWADGYLPILRTTFLAAGVGVVETVLATTIGVDQKGLALVRFDVTGLDRTKNLSLCLCVSAMGPTGYVRTFGNVQSVEDRRLSFAQYDPAGRVLEVNRGLGPVFDPAPTQYGVYGGDPSGTPAAYYTKNAYFDLISTGKLNGVTSGTDYDIGLAHAAFVWDLSGATNTFRVEARLPIDSFQGSADLATLRGTASDTLIASDQQFWHAKLDGSGLQASLPASIRTFFDQFRLCRAILLMLSEDGAIHPGPTVYDSFWIRDSSVEGIACALAGDQNLAWRQFAQHYTEKAIFHQEQRQIGPVSSYGFFGGEHEETNKEWDSNGEALWALGRFDRISGPSVAFGAKVFSPYVVLGARWLRDNRASNGLLPAGWSAEHLGSQEYPHYWDDYWAVAGLYEASALARRLNASAVQELQEIFVTVRDATAASIDAVVAKQQRNGQWQTFIPTGPANTGELDSTLIGTVAYFQPCRLYMGQKLGPAVDYAARMTLETIWSNFVQGGFRHDAAWEAYGSYLTLQLAHAFLFLGMVDRMELCLTWALDTAAHATSRGAQATRWSQPVVVGAWNEQHCYPIATDFAEFPANAWWMGDIPHGWAAAEYNLLIRDMLFFEADEDGDKQIFLAPGILPHWFAANDILTVHDAPTIYGTTFGYELSHDLAQRTVTISIAAPIPGVRMIYPCRFGSRIASAVADGHVLPAGSIEVQLPAGTKRAKITYA